MNQMLWDHQCGFRRNVLTTYQIFSVRQILEKELGVSWDSI